MSVDEMYNKMSYTAKLYDKLGEMTYEDQTYLFENIADNYEMIAREALQKLEEIKKITSC